MISTLQGTVCAIGLDFVVLEVAGIGYHVRTSPPTLADLRIGNEALLHTELVVREDSLTLYGFLSHEETELFRTVQSVSGIGPRIALAVLAVMPPWQFAKAVIAEDIKAITSIPGIGPKGAKRLALELKEKVAPFAAGDELAQADAAEPQIPESEDQPLNGHAKDVVKALIGLGWPEKTAESAVNDCLNAVDAATPGSAREMDAAHILRLALRHLGGRQ